MESPEPRRLDEVGRTDIPKNTTHTISLLTTPLRILLSRKEKCRIRLTGSISLPDNLVNAPAHQVNVKEDKLEADKT